MSTLNSAAHLSDTSGSLQTRPEQLRSIVRVWKRISIQKETTVPTAPCAAAPRLRRRRAFGASPWHRRVGLPEVCGEPIPRLVSDSGHGPDINLWYPPGLPLLLTPFRITKLMISRVHASSGAAWLFVAVVLFYLLLRLTVLPRVALVGAIALGVDLPMFLYAPAGAP